MRDQDYDQLLSVLEKDYLLLTLFVMAYHGYFDKALTLVRAIRASGDNSEEIAIAEAIIHFVHKDYSSALGLLDTVDEKNFIVKRGKVKPDTVPSERGHMLAYVKARCLHELGRKSEAGDLLDVLTQK